MKESQDWEFCRDMPANYEFDTIYGKTIKMEGILRDAVELDEKMRPVFWLLVPKIPDQWMVWFQSKYISAMRRTPVAYHGNGLNLYKPQVKIYHPNFEFNKLSNGLLEIKIVEGSLWKET